ncbi:N-acetylglutaminylglutamine synthetase [Arsenicitalea aurantiaca]|uniref:N-acetylglutaminylglutamine synthetase n=1 Tax=Arsenicitalea aurantiaca TaxID=1783274 RepID=A0A433XKI6_9HYPH|nr:N-acetylglutaminylglutamine synthetase [Arsenicitalea aurantiaca]RUT34585.1 N-acetylglutaminylglutamine synthetase [Arsenicitalea aurantiaca]
MSDRVSTRGRREAHAHRLERMRRQGPKPLSTAGLGHAPMTEPTPNAVLDCGWGRLLFGQTFQSPEALADALRAEAPDRRDVAFYIRDPHVAVAAAPQEIFLDPSHTYRLDLSTYRPGRRRISGFFVRRLSSETDATEVNRIYAARGMVTVKPEFFWSRRDSRAITVFVAEDERTGAIIGTAMGVDHVRAFEDPELGASLWCLAVDPQTEHPGIGEALVRRIAEHFASRGAATLDLSVLHDNEHAIALYEKLGFRRVPLYTVKRKNPINEKLFTGPAAEFDALNPYARLLVDEAWRRGIMVDVTDAEGGFFRLTNGGRSILCRESLTELTSAVAMSICDDKAVTRRVVERAGVIVPTQIEAGDRQALEAFLAEHGSVVVKPARGEQGRGVAVGLTTLEEIDRAIATAREVSDRVIIEEQAEGEDLRLVIINFELVAAALRRPARIVGNGTDTIRTLIARQSRRRAAATGGESTIPLDAETERCVGKSGFGLDDVAPAGIEIAVRSTANLHTGGTLHDVTATVHPALVDAAIRAARAIDIPVVGIDFMVPDPHGSDYAFIEANERPGLANHEPQPTAERFIDLLFPNTAARS